MRKTKNAIRWEVDDTHERTGYIENEPFCYAWKSICGQWFIDAADDSWWLGYGGCLSGIYCLDDIKQLAEEKYLELQLIDNKKRYQAGAQ